MQPKWDVTPNRRGISTKQLTVTVLTRALLGGGVWTPPPPSGFSRLAKIRRRAAPTSFHPPYPASFAQLLWKFRPNAMWGQVIRSGQVIQLQRNFPIAPRLQRFRESYATFVIWWVHQCLQKRISRIFWYRWPQVRSFLRPPHYKSMGKKSTPLYLLSRKPIWVESHRIGQLWTIWVKICIAYPSKGHLRSPRGHQPSFANNFWSKKYRDVGLVSVRSSCQGESNDMQYDPFRPSRDLGLTWPEVKLWPWPFKVILYMVRRALTRQTRYYQICCSTFKIKDFIVKKPFWKILEFWPLEASILTWDKKWPKWFRNDFSRAFERCLLFFSTATRSRDHGGAFERPPMISAPGRRREKRKAAFESSRKIISKSFSVHFFGSDQNWGHQGSKFQNFPKRFFDNKIVNFYR